jgi:hypothetical protein
MQNHLPLHKMSITPNIVMFCIDIQGEEHHCREEQGILGKITFRDILNPPANTRSPVQYSKEKNMF